jgi:hypothetical protein
VFMSQASIIVCGVEAMSCAHAGCGFSRFPCSYLLYYIHSLVFFLFTFNPVVMSIKKNGVWQFEKKLATTIKETLFDTGVVDPTSYNKADIIAAKYEHSDFLIDEDVWCVAFRRAACEYNLQKDHEEVESRRFQPRGRYQVSSNSSVKTATATTKVSPRCESCGRNAYALTVC